MGTTPLTIDSPVAGGKLVIEVSAKGHKMAQVEVEGGHDGDLVVTLDKIEKPKPAVRPRKPRSKKKRKKKAANKPEPFMLE